LTSELGGNACRAASCGILAASSALLPLNGVEKIKLEHYVIPAAEQVAGRIGDFTTPDTRVNQGFGKMR
jgi:hypothetical protein